MFDEDDPLDESEDLGQHNQDLEEAGNGDHVDSAAGTIAGVAGTLLTAGMLFGPRLTLQRRRQRVQEWVCTPVTCPDCACGVCCALDLCGTEFNDVNMYIRRESRLLLRTSSSRLGRLCQLVFEYLHRRLAVVTRSRLYWRRYEFILKVLWSGLLHRASFSTSSSGSSVRMAR